MKKARFSEEKIIRILKQQEAGMKVADLARSMASVRPRSTTGSLFSDFSNNLI